jgi:hypothetical protein
MSKPRPSPLGEISLDTLEQVKDVASRFFSDEEIVMFAKAARMPSSWYEGPEGEVSGFMRDFVGLIIAATIAALHDREGSPTH